MGTNTYAIYFDINMDYLENAKIEATSVNEAYGKFFKLNPTKCFKDVYAISQLSEYKEEWIRLEQGGMGK